MSKENGVPPLWQFIIGGIIVAIIFALLFGTKEIIQILFG